MSDNTIVLGLAIGQRHFTAALHALTALFGYLAGVGMVSLRNQFNNSEENSIARRNS